jgi:hypothetical protein
VQSSSSVPTISSVPDATLHELLIALRLTALALPATSEGDEPTITTCAVCQLTSRSVTRWLRAFLAEYVNDTATRETVRRAGGFCAAHTRQLAALGDSLAIAILYSDLARLTRERWDQSTKKNRFTKSLTFFLGRWRIFKPSSASLPAPCPACVAENEAQTRYVTSLADGLSKEGLSKTGVWEAMQANGGLCVPHIQQIMTHATPDAALRLLQLETQRLSDLQAELEEIVRKNDYRFRGETWGAEKDAWRRALDKLKRQSP